MEELIPISEQNGKKAVSARLLHAFLESKQDFSNWIQNRIKKYSFIENQDFEVFNNFIENPSGGRPLIEYALSLSCAKEIAMVEGNAKGKQARQYFIECERNLKEQANRLPQTFAEALRLAAIQAEQIELQKKELQASAPKIEYFEKVLQSGSTNTMTQIAKELGMSAYSLEKRLHEKGVIFKQSGQWLLYAKYQDKGYAKPRTHHYTKSDGSTGTNTITVWTESGREFIHSLLQTN